MRLLKTLITGLKRVAASAAILRVDRTLTLPPNPVLRPCTFSKSRLTSAMPTRALVSRRDNLPGSEMPATGKSLKLGWFKWGNFLDFTPFDRQDHPL